MTKKVFALLLAGLMLISCLSSFAGCKKDSDEDGADGSAKEYTIQYTDEWGTHTLTVTNGMPYVLEVVPEKTGYDFMGLYDAEAGGTQYVSASGASLAPFTDRKNMILFPQYKAKEFTVILDYQGAAVTGGRQLTVTYGSSLPELPKNLIGEEHKEFAGWYTEAECGGIRVADQYGLIPLVSVLNEQNFDISLQSITLYAGFEWEKHTVTCCFETGMDTEDVQVAYGTPAGNIVPNTRVNGNAVLTWSKTQGGEVWNGKVTGDMVLYAVEYAPVIELDSNGGKEVTPVVARPGATIALPEPTKDLAKFSHWEDMQGNPYTSTKMPSKSISLKAVWQAKLVFDENGGSDVDDISESAGTAITLPVPEKEGFLFAGWYTAGKEPYTSTTMPAAGVKLRAGWYKAKSKIINLIVDNEVWECRKTPSFSNNTNDTFSLGETINGTNKILLKIKWHMKLTQDASSNDISICVNFYSQKTISDAYLLGKLTFTNVNDSYKEYEKESILSVDSTTFYYSWYTPNNASNDLFTHRRFWVKDFYAEVAYPDTSILYL